MKTQGHMCESEKVRDETGEVGRGSLMCHAKELKHYPKKDEKCSKGFKGEVRWPDVLQYGGWSGKGQIRDKANS